MFSNFRTFMMVYELRSFSQAADKLFLSQPTVTNQISQLEKKLNTNLFIRKGKRIFKPTKSADLLYKFSNDLFYFWNETEAKIKNVDNLNYVQLRIGVSQSIAHVLFPQISAALQKDFPNIEYNVQVSNSMAIIKSMESRKLDFGFIEQPLSLPGIKRIDLCTDQLVLAGEDNGTWITREDGSGVGYYNYQYLQETGIKPQQIKVVNNNQMLIDLLKNKIGQSLVSSNIDLDGVVTKEIGEKYLRKFYLLYDGNTDWDQQDDVIALIKDIATTYQAK